MKLVPPIWKKPVGKLVPERRGDMAKLGMRVMPGSLLASYLTAKIAGFLL